MAARPLLKVSIISDIACPWCYVGKRRLDKALAQVRQKVGQKVGDGRPVELEWHAYLLDPRGWALEEHGEEIQEYGMRRFGPGFPTMIQRVINSGRQDGAEFANWKYRASTLRGHMLVVLAREHGKDHEAAELLFQANYEQGKDVTRLDVLLDIASQLGLREEAERRLGGAPAGAKGRAIAAAAANGSSSRRQHGGTAGAEGQEGPACGVGEGTVCAAAAADVGSAGGSGEEGEEGELDGELLRVVQEEDAFAKNSLRVSGVPFFLISSAQGEGRQYALSGAQPVEAFLEAFDLVLSGK